MKRIKSLALVFWCFIFSIWRGRACRVPKIPQKICVIQLAKLGDMVCTTPVFSALKKHYPQAQVWVVGDRVNNEVLAGHPAVAGYIVWRNKPIQMASTLKKHRFDAVCITAPHTEALAAAYLSGAPCVVVPKIQGGVSPYETRSYKLLRTLALSRPHTMGRYAPREYLRLIEPLGIVTDDTTKTLSVSPTSLQEAETMLTEFRKTRSCLIGIAPAAGNRIKQWPPKRFAEVADALIENHQATVILFGGPNDAQETEAMVRAVRHKESVYSTQGKLSIELLKALISQLDLFISADTGPIYIAEAFGIPTVDIIGPMDEHEQPPRGEKHTIVVGERDKPELHIMNARVYNREEARRQALGVSSDAVIAAAQKLL